ncbi:MFS transporter [Acerihabitans sp. TG2]|uniref:MFS transporter n=1 Tax=Acerihabitans sp. TG2 TaxID=3096008 RepID=UPI002B22820C|nr:MFS transporter [Acerihabitans sp. TG2]MEA9391505.1 MFS transporter [Acerihabitans sp. TG2]
MKTGFDSPTLGRSGLLVLLAGQLLPMIDFSIVNVALDAMSATLHASSIQLALIVAVYGIAFAVSLATGGRMGDNYGRRRVFTLGVVLFGAASLLCGVANSVWLLLLARALQGIGAALVVPQILATLHVCLHGREHTRAIGLYGGIGGLAFIVGQVLGGFLIFANIGGYGWRSVFLINIPLCLLIVLLASRTIPETKKSRQVSIDLSGTLLLAGAIGCLLVALALGPLLHWSWPCILLLAAFPLLLNRLWWVEVTLENNQGSPLLPPSLIRLNGVRFGLSIAVLFFSCWSGFMFAVALTLQSGLGMTPFQSGNAFIVLGTAYFLGSMYSTRAVEKWGKLTTLLTGCTLQMAGLLALMATFQIAWPDVGALALGPATALIGLGQSFIVSCFYRIGLSDVPKDHAGAGSALLSTVQQAAFGLGPMLLGTVYTLVLQQHGNYKTAVLAVLIAEWILMLVLVVRAVISRHQIPALPSQDAARDHRTRSRSG